ncbi:MAG TPA: low molecular weight protein-tyrosine-phosphatase [Gallionella sp.]|nr:low molecular weight protein-tyrosine-phosphatase [Gallionella sp.]
MEKELGVLFVCTANICRSPTAEAVFRHKATQSGLIERLRIDSAGTHDYRVGAAPDLRAQSVAGRRGYEMSGLRARQVTRADLERFDYVLAMDMKNMTALHRLGEPDLWQKPRLLMSYSRLYKVAEIADPYGAGEDRFELVLDMIESAADGLLAAIRMELQQRGQG